MTQTSMFDHAGRIPAQTRRAAQEAIEGARTALQRRVVDALRTLGPLTDEQLQDHTGLSANTERPRRRELVQAGVVVAVDDQGRTRSGARATRWGLKP